MEKKTWLSAAFEEHRVRLTALASRMLGSKTEADDAVQEAWIRFNRSDTSDVENLGAWLTTVVSRVCLNALQSRRKRSTAQNGTDVADLPLEGTTSNPEHEMLLADSVGVALLIVLDTLSPTERVAFVLHDMFAVPFEDIAPIVGRNATATRQLASRARRRVQATDTERGTDRLRQSKIVDAFLSAARQGDFAALIEVLDPDAVLRADAAAVVLGGPEEARGAETVAGYLRRAGGARPVLVDGVPAAAGMSGGHLRIVLLFGFSGDKMTTIELIAEPERLATLDLVVSDDS
jgi:RNA polymerase sigma factor (sigma-70 family)